jgi:hypothetical protein
VSLIVLFDHLGDADREHRMHEEHKPACDAGASCGGLPLYRPRIAANEIRVSDRLRRPFGRKKAASRCS